MKVFFEAKRLFYNHTGLGNYCRWLLRGLHRFHPDDEWHLLKPGKRRSGHAAEFSPPDYHLHEYADPLGLARVFTLAGMVGPGGILHGLSAELPAEWIPGKIRQLVTVHDLIFHTRRSDYAFIDRNIYMAKLRHAVRVADRIVCVSRFTADELITHTAAQEEKIRVIYQNCDPVFYLTEVMPSDPALKSRLPERYWLSVSSFAPRKNLIRIAEALRNMKAADRVPVVMIGGGPLMDEFIRTIRQFQLEDCFVFPGPVDTATLAWLYRNSLGLIYPSLIEGFGIPAVEAMASGVPVIAHRGSVIQEVAGGAGLYADCSKADELAGAILRLQDDAQLRSTLKEQSVEELKKFEDRRLIGSYHQLYSEMTAS